MNGKKVISSCRDKIEEVVSSLGLTLVDIEYTKKVNGMVLELFIDSPNGITLSDCERVSRALDKPLDDINPTNDEPYCLNVSSLGLDRPLTTEYQFNKYKGQDVEVKFYEPVKPFNKKLLIGTLLDWDVENVTLLIEGQKENTTFQKSKIAQIVPVINF